VGRIIKRGEGWQVGWDGAEIDFQGLVGTDDWALELTEAELNDFGRLFAQLVATMEKMKAELMAEESIAIELESDLLWLEAEGYPDAYTLHLILLTGRRGEGRWAATVVPQLWQAVQTLQVF
jgi:hypothetical protein